MSAPEKTVTDLLASDNQPTQAAQTATVASNTAAAAAPAAADAGQSAAATPVTTDATSAAGTAATLARTSAAAAPITVAYNAATAAASSAAGTAATALEKKSAANLSATGGASLQAAATGCGGGGAGDSKGTFTDPAANQRGLMLAAQQCNPAGIKAALAGGANPNDPAFIEMYRALLCFNSRGTLMELMDAMPHIPCLIELINGGLDIDQRVVLSASAFDPIAFALERLATCGDNLGVDERASLEAMSRMPRGTSLREQIRSWQSIAANPILTLESNEQQLMQQLLVAMRDEPASDKSSKAKKAK